MGGGGGGGAASGILLRKYLQDLDEYLKKDARVCIVKHMLRIYFGPMILYYAQIQKKRIPKQLNGLKRLCASNTMTVNETKTKLMIFCFKIITGEIMFNDKRIELVSEYKYLGNIIRSTETTAQDMFSTNHPYLCDRANRATRVWKQASLSTPQLTETHTWVRRHCSPIRYIIKGTQLGICSCSQIANFIKFTFYHGMITSVIFLIKNNSNRHIKHKNPLRIYENMDYFQIMLDIVTC